VPSSAVPHIEILGVPVSRVTMRSALATIEKWLSSGESHYICACDVHSLMRARSDPSHMRALREAGMITPDGQPVVWTAHARGIADIERVCGPDLMPLLCEQSASRPWTHFFYGGADGVAADLAQRLSADYPGLKIAGMESPPYRALSFDEQRAALDRIRLSGANVLWVGLGCPKQENWMFLHRHALPGVVMIGVGAAFDFYTRRVERAPIWMRQYGLEWLHRLLSEPQRLWRRYLVLAPRFAVASIAETAKLRLHALWRKR
jgi:N-acetylglucosaminyldiphosphoundecaprenol N-acetyl-beta-D-mannosaminyltransferase